MQNRLVPGIKTGIIFGIIISFLFLIGFLSTIAGLIGDFVKIDLFQNAGFSVEMVNMLIFLAILGVWAGVSSARGSEQNDLGGILLSGITVGLSTGIFVGLVAYIIGSLQEANVRMITYLSAMLPRTINLFLLDLSALNAALFYVLFYAICGIIGVSISKSLLDEELRSNYSQRLASFIKNLKNVPLVQQIRRNPITRYIIYGSVILALFLIPLNLGQYWNYTLGTVGIYVLLGLGLNIVVGLAGLLDLGYVAFFAIGAYSVALLTAPAPHNIGMSFWLALMIGIILAAFAGILLGIPVLRLRGDYLAIVTLGFGEIIRILSKSDILTSFTGGPRGVTNIGGPNLFGRPFTSNVDYVYLTVLACLLIIFVTRRLQNSRIGRAWIAMREDETVAQAMGINTMHHKLLAFAIGAAFAGLGGVLFAARNQFTGPEDHNLMVSINVLSLIIVGGMGSVPGVIAGAFVLKGLPEVLRELENYRVLAFGALLVTMMVLRPGGLIPSARRSLELQHPEHHHEGEKGSGQEEHT
jgi:ABC-type branched-subunit amino acid transport system permease subunit